VTKIIETNDGNDPAYSVKTQNIILSKSDIL